MPQAHASSPAHSQAHASSPCQAHASSPAHPQAHASSPCQAPASSPCLKPIYFPLFPFILIGFQVGSRLVPGWFQVGRRRRRRRRRLMTTGSLARCLPLTHPGVTYPVRGYPSLRCYSWVREGQAPGHGACCHESPSPPPPARPFSFRHVMRGQDWFHTMDPYWFFSSETRL